jgi:hypothetical protein
VFRKKRLAIIEREGIPRSINVAEERNFDKMLTGKKVIRDSES